MAISEAIDFVGHAIEGMAVWRYLFPPTYRATVHKRWRHQSGFETGMEIFYFSLSFIFVTIVAGGLGWLAVSSILSVLLPGQLVASRQVITSATGISENSRNSTPLYFKLPAVQEGTGGGGAGA